MRAIFLLLLLVGAVLNTAAQGKLYKENYTLVWADEFDYDSLAQLQASNYWKIEDRAFAESSTSICTPDNISFSTIAPHNRAIHFKAAKASDPALYGGYAYTGSGIELKWDIDPRSGPCDWLKDFPEKPWLSWQHGFQYGMVEIRCKLPSTLGITPAAWLINADTEIDLIDNQDFPSTMWGSGVLDWRWQNLHKSPYIGDYSCGGQILKPADARNGAQDLAEDYNVYNVVWTRDRITVFLNGREQYTVLQKDAPGSISTLIWDWTTTASHAAADCLAGAEHTNGYACTATLRLGVSTTQKTAAVTSAGDVMSIDYVRIYKPVAGLADAYYLNPQEYRNYRVRDGAVATLVYPAPGAIAVNTTDADELFFRGTDHIIYQSHRLSNDQWASNAVDSYQGGHPAWIVNGDISYNPALRALTYVGRDGKLQQFRFAPDSARHPWTLFRHNWLARWPPRGARPLGIARSLATAANGDVYYIGRDYQIHQYQWSGKGWVYHRIPYAYAADELAIGDLVLEDAGQAGVRIYYKGKNQRVQCFYPGDGYYTHATIGPLGPVVAPVSLAPGSLAVGPDGNVFYVGQDGEVHRYFRSLGGDQYREMPTGWTHDMPRISEVAQPPAQRPLPAAAEAAKPHPQGSLAWDAHGQQLLYLGLDGRVQSIYNTSTRSLEPGTWASRWVDDFFNTTAFLGLNRTASGTPFDATSPVEPIAAGADGSIFYHGNEGHQLRYFLKSPAQYLHSTCLDPAMQVH